MGLEPECEYYNWERLCDNEDFWDLVERIDEIQTRNRAVEAQKSIFKAEKYKELAYRVGFDTMRELLLEETEEADKPIPIGKIKKKMLYKRVIALSRNGFSTREISQQIKVHHSTIHRWIKYSRRNNACNRNDENKFQRRNMVEEAGC